MYEYILKRKSIRNFDMNGLNDDAINDIKKYIETIIPYDSSIKTQTFILNDEKQIAGLFKVKAPHYIAITSEKKDDYLINAGYILENLVIYLTSIGIGTCWLGGSKPTADIVKLNELDYVTMIAIGKPNETLYRKDISEFKRKNITEISNLSDSNTLIEAIRLAPSASNQQAWYFEMKDDEISVYCKKVIKLMERMSKIDIGIALAHMYIAAQCQNKDIELTKEKDKVKSGYEYVITCKLV